MPNFWDASIRLDLLLSEAISEMGTMDRLAEKLKQAAGVAQRATTRIEARADELIAREGKIRKREDEAFSPHETILSDAEKGLDAVERALGQMSNGPLPDSGSSYSEVSDSVATQASEPQTNPAPPLTQQAAPTDYYFGRKPES